MSVRAEVLDATRAALGGRHPDQIFHLAGLFRQVKALVPASAAEIAAALKIVSNERSRRRRGEAQRRPMYRRIVDDRSCRQRWR
jgi:hypothetical protein